MHLHRYSGGFGKRVALLLVLVMVAGVFAPFGTGRVVGLVAPLGSVRAAAATPVTPLAVYMPHSGLLQAWPSQPNLLMPLRLVGGLEGEPVAFDTGGMSDNDVMVAWRVDPSVGATGMHVLRYFTQNGAKVEMWVIHEPGEATLSVEYRVFSRMTTVDENATFFGSLPRIYYDYRTLPGADDAVVFTGLRNLTPPGHAFTCPVDGVNFRFMWGRNVPGGTATHRDLFFLHIEGGVSPGFVYDFTLEFYDNEQMAVYRESDMKYVRWIPNDAPENTPSRITINASAPAAPLHGRAPIYSPSMSDRIFVFRGFSAADVEIFPFAYALNPAGDLAPHTPFLGSEAHAGDTISERPGYLRHTLDVTNRDEHPGMHDNGMDIRVRLPRFFDEQTGRFSMDHLVGLCAHDLPRMELRLSVGSPGVRTESFQIIVPDVVYDLPLWATTRPETPGAVRFYDSRSLDREPITLTDASRLVARNTHNEDISIARFRVTNLMPSIMYDQMMLGLIPRGADYPPPLRDPRQRFVDEYTIFRFPEQDIRLHTLLHYRFTAPIGGTVYVVIDPFRRHDWDSPIMHWPGWPGAIEGYYLFGEEGLGGVGAIRVHFNGNTDTIRIPVIHPQRFSYSLLFLFGPERQVESQNVVITPDDGPTVGLPNFFDITRRAFRPRRLPPAIAPGAVADLTFDLTWELGTMDALRAMIDSTSTSPGALDGEVTIIYYLFRSLTPDREHPEKYAEIHVRLSHERAPLTYVYAEYTVIFENRPQAPIAVTTSPSSVRLLGTTSVMARIDGIETIAMHNVHGQGMLDEQQQPHFRDWRPPDHTWHAPLSFPGVYHMYLQPVSLYRGCPNDSNVVPEDLFYYGQGWPSSRTRSLTLDDFGQMLPPPPMNFNAVSQADPDVPPALQVSFDVPVVALNAYMAQQYPFDPLVRFNVYVGANEDAVNNLKDNHPGISLPASNSINFMERADPANNTITLRPEELALLRNGGILRIADIPLDRPFDIDVISNWQEEDINNNYTRALAASIYALSRAERLAIPFTLTGIDENTRYFLFADLVVERFVQAGTEIPSPPAPEPETAGDPIFENGNHVIVHSVPTELSGGVTIGTPQVPGPIEVDPAAPTGIGHMDLGQSYVTVFWDYIASDDPNVAIEFEIVRVTDNRLDVESLVDANGNLMSLAQIVAMRPDAVAWRTNVHYQNFIPGATEPFLQVYRGGPPVVHGLGDGDTAYGFHPVFITTETPPGPGERVALIDRTLRPNNLYFYYVRTLRRVIFEDPAAVDADGNPVTHILQNRSSWVEESVTTPVVQAPVDLRVEDGETRAGFDPLSQQFVSWTHPAANVIIQALRLVPDAGMIFQYQLRVDGEVWGEERTVPVSHMINPHSFVAGRFYYMVRGLDAGTVYQMRVRVLDRDTGDASLWSNIITFMTDWDDEQFALEREADNWLAHLRRLLLEQLRQPFWVSVDTPDLLRVVYRPDAFRGLLDATTGTVALHNTDARTMVYYLPVSGMLEANEARRGFTTRYGDMDVVFAPRFLSEDHNRAIMDMARHVANRNLPVNDYFVRVTLERRPVVGLLGGNPPAGDAVDVRIDLVGVNTNTRNIRTWDTNFLSRAEQAVERRLTDPVLRQSILNLIERDDYFGERSEYIMLDFVARIEAEVAAELNAMVTRDVPFVSDEVGIVSPTIVPVTALNAPIHIVSTNNAPDVSIAGFALVSNVMRQPEWQGVNLVAQANGPAIIAQAPGRFAFSSHVVSIPGIANVPGGHTVTSLVVRFGLSDVFGHGDVDLHRNATRQMVTGSIARLAGAPAGVDPVSWVANNMNVTLANRNAVGLVAQQEAVAMVMALYERRTNTQVSSIIIRNHQATAGMVLDNRYAQAVRAAIELGIVNAEDFQPGTPATIGDLLNILAALDVKVGL